MTDPQEILRRAGLKVTPQRLEIYEMLLQTRAHPGAQEVYEVVKEKLPSISFNTVYATLLSLQEKGLIQRLDVGQGRDRFDANTRSHVHLVCQQCGRVDDFGDSTPACISELLAEVRAKSGWKIADGTFTAYGYCPECRRAKDTERPGR
ncbi:MAG TPA: transcriptional repressor [Firmicutes bacterium]|nr:transcriptional repressor [Candidatus Fermentithermobacillaceae bacterium]